MKHENITRNEEGRFKRAYDEWTPENFDNGYKRKDGRFFVLMPSHPRANPNGWVLRNIVAYEHYHSDVVTSESCIHHKNGNKTDDSKENLEKIEFKKHSIEHNEWKKNGKIYKCSKCGKEFYRAKWRVKASGGYQPKYCSQKCFIKRGKK